MKGWTESKLEAGQWTRRISVSPSTLWKTVSKVESSVVHSFVHSFISSYAVVFNL
jgi:hypothetical protein